jgi:choline dehydrogenase-like flavoprotein
MPDGGFLVSDLSAVWRVRPDGIIVRFAGTLAATRGPGQGDGGPARSAGIGVPTGLARATGGDVLIAEAATGRVRGVGDDGRIRKLVDLAPLARDGARVGDFAGRTPPASLQGIAVTAEGGIAMAAGHLYYRAPRDTFRTLVALRDARVSERRVAVEFDATQPGTARLQVRRRGLLVASTPARRVRAGRSTLRVAGRFAPRTHEVSVRLTGPGYATARDDVSLFTSRVLPAVGRDDELATRMREAAEGAIGDTGAIDRCRRQTARRIDCAVIDLDGDRCVAVLAFTLRPSGALFERPYVCRSRGRVFRRRPAWTDPAEALR